MNPRFTVIRDPFLREEVWLAHSRQGLRVRVTPTSRFRETMAVVGFEYGSVDLGFVSGGARVTTPEGTAHFLEHKLFEDEEIQVFERFARRGARVNASTGFARTSYHFVASDHFEANLEDLLHLVARAHLTDANVEKERGIIAQEIRMHEDSPDWRAIFDLLGCLYEQHPVRHPVGGTVASIAEITKELLFACHAAFYRCGNAALSVAGPIDPDRVLELADRCALPSGAPQERIVPDDSAAPKLTSANRVLGAARPRALLGYKEAAPSTDPAARLEQDLLLRIVLDRLLAPSSELKERLVASGVVDDSLTAMPLSDRGFSFVVLHGETDAPPRWLEAVRELVESEVLFEADHLERARRKLIGQHVRSFENVQAIAGLNLADALEDRAPFQTLARLAAIDTNGLLRRKAEVFRAAMSAEVVVT